MENFSKKIDFKNIEPSELHKDKLIIAASSALAGIGTLLPWYTLRLFGARANASGIEFFAGQIVLVSSLLLIATMLEGKSNQQLSQRNTYLGLGLGGLNLLALLTKLGNTNAIGFWISLIATVVAGLLLFKALTGKDLLKEAGQKAKQLKDKTENKINEMQEEKKDKPEA